MSFTNELPWNKYGMIIELTSQLEGVSPQIGKTVIQKMMYLLNRVSNVPTGYDHTLYTYGPYSSELSEDVAIVSAMGGVKLNDGIRGGYEISPSENAPWILSKSNEFVTKYTSEIKKLVETFGKYKARELELRSTLIFLSQNDLKIEVEELKIQLLDLKPYFSEEEVLNAIDELKKMKVCC